MNFKTFYESKGPNLNVECIRGPFRLLDEYTDADDDDLGYECLVNGSKFVIGEDPLADNFRYIHAWDDEALYKQYHDVILSLANKAIEDYKLKSNLSKDTRQSFNDLLDII